MAESANSAESKDFIRQEVENDTESGRFDKRVHLRFPPEPNGYLHIGHLKAIAVNFGIADDFGGECNLRFDDTNPTKEKQDFVDGIIEDIRWMGYEPNAVFYASDYFGQLYEWAVQLIKQGDAYVDDLSQEQMREYRGDFKKPGKNSPFRDRSVAENLELFERMKQGEFEPGTRVLRAKIDMGSPIINMRDPVMYRILNEAHHRTGDEWHIYPMYDWAHGQSDSIEGITHSLCSLEYVNHRPLYDWFLEKLGVYAPRQIEFARGNLSHTIVSKRYLRRLVEEGHVDGWDDPRMPTLVGLRRRGYPPKALIKFWQDAGVARSVNLIMLAQLEAAVRDELNATTQRVMAVLDPIKVTVTNYPDDQIESFELPNYPQDKENTEKRTVTFSRELFIEREDFEEVAPPKWKRLALGWTVRLLGAYFVTATDVIKDEDGNVTEVLVEYLPETRGGFRAEDAPKPKGTLHWVSAETSLPATINLYSTLFSAEKPGKETGDFIDDLNPTSLETLTNARVEASLGDTFPEKRYQFMRMGYFVTDQASTADNLIFNRTVTLRDVWERKS